MKSFLFVVMLIAFSLSSFAEKIDRAVAEKVAVNFFTEKSTLFNHATGNQHLNITESVLVNETYFIVNFEEGWVLVSADDAMTPVIGYNYDGNFPTDGNLDQNMTSWLQYFTDQLNYVNENQVKPTEEVAQTWEKYLTFNAESLKSAGVRGQVSPLLTAKWNQDNPYNVLCPEDADGPGGHVYVGCVATAMSLIMHYWRYPEQGNGSHSYFEYPYGTLTANYGEAVYDWNSMQDVIDPHNPWEIAEIGYHAAVSVDMGFSPSGSGAYSWDVPNALKNYFGYKNTVQYIEKSNYNFSTWEGMIQSELEAGHPMYYSGFSNEGGHAFVLDGYEGDNYYHFNFGWSGSGNGYYTLQDVNGFSGGQGMVRNIIPGDVNYPYVADGMTVLTSFSGSFTDGSGPVDFYPSGMNASWLIDPQTDIDSISSIDLKFIEFNTSASDVLRIYAGATTDSELIGEYSGNELPNAINYDGNKMLLTFSSSGTGAGFKIEYKTSQPSWCLGSETFSEPFGILSDGSGSFYYSNSSTCVYVIESPEATQITLEFTQMFTEEGKDKVKVYNEANQLIGEYSGYELPEVITEEGSMLILVWTTNSTVRSQGWVAEYTINGVGIRENAAENMLVYPNPTSDKLNVSFDVERAGELNIRMVNLSGQLVYEETQSGFSGKYNNTLDLSRQAKGVYLLSIITDKGKFDKKIVLK